MKHRNKKRKAAIWILEEICKPGTYRIIGIYEPDNYQKINEKYYDIYGLKSLTAKNKYSQELLREAVDLLTIKEHIEIFENEKDIYDIRIRAFKNGEIALNEDVYQDEIDEYNSNTIFRWTRIWLPILAIVIALISLVVSIRNHNHSNLIPNQIIKGTHKVEMIKESD